ncbi:SPFH domain-containing protein [Nocardiopsis sp. RSe5-2]|uniref:SPFH domain-containing protein n=1 Tax=Nocardiopsis endophytica TaxID=3018445 RepID=A0ABT4TZM6_9ACTN|nr:SPFH domain-containing protein [Nocardiopsis endophytica]MDA2810149.1 SPFH domain-containing protein [Nocardiopsis endophytica]
MGTIRTYPGLRHYLGTATDHVVHLSRGEVRRQGVGRSFWFRPNTVLSEVPATDQELPVLFHAITRDQQDVTVQANITYRFADPVLASRRLDFGIFPVADDGGQAKGREQAGVIVGQLAQSAAVDAVTALELAEALETGVARVREALTAGLRDDTRLSATGIEVLGVRVLAVRPEADVEKALQTPVRERLQAEADRATYERRAVAVERERAISENELASQIELATRRERLVAQEGANKQREASEAAAAALISSRAWAERRGIETDAKAAETRELGAAEAAKEAEIMQVYASLGRDVLTALALRDAAGALPAVGSITITPDLVSGLLGALADRGAAPPEDDGTAPASGRDAR